MRQTVLVLAFLAVTAKGFNHVRHPPPQRTESVPLATTRRESFGEIMGSALLPIATAAAAPEVASAQNEYGDPYPFRVSNTMGTVLS